MHVPVPDLIGRPGATRPLVATVGREDVGGPLGDWGPSDEALRGPLSLDLTLEMLLEGLFVRGSVAFTTTIPCARCLVDVTTDVSVPVAELFADPAQLEEDDEIDAGYELAVAEAAIDLEALLRDAVGSSLPYRQLCDEACAGLCPSCGADLNEGDCGHRRGPAPDPRWAALEQLQGQLPPSS